MIAIGTKIRVPEFSLSARASWIALCLLAVLFSVDSFAQKQMIEHPQMKTFKPIGTGYYFNSALDNPSPKTNPSAYPSSMGATADDIINQSYSRVQGPVYRPGMTPPEMQQANMKYIQQQMANEPAYNPPSYKNNYNNKAIDQLKEIRDAINEIHSNNSSHKFNSAYFKTPEFAEKTKHYYDALSFLNNMASGKAPMSLKEAYYKMESAYGNTYLTKKEYDRILKESGEFIKIWMQQNGFDYNNQEAKHLAVQRFLSDTLEILMPNPDSKRPPVKKKHYPFQYDYDDFKGEKDHRNYFVTKSLATGTGQCNSMPADYLLLCEQIGATAYLSLAPLHSLIMYPDNNGTIHNYEPTTNWSMNNQQYTEIMGITSQALASGIYLDTLGKRAIVADCMLQLAFGYLRKYGIGDEKFITNCINYSLNNIGKQKLIDAYFLLSDYYAIQLDNLLTQNGIKDLNKIDKIPEAKFLHDKYIETEVVIQKLGYQEMPPALYEDLMQQMDKKGRIQKDKNIHTKEKHSLFVKSF